MIIERLDLIAYGRFTDTSIDLSAGPRRFHIVYGPNESGKSTSLRAITSLLYGMSARAEDNYVHANAKIRVGGVLTDADGKSLPCIRRRGNKGTLRELDDRTMIADEVLKTMLGGVDREAFEHRFGLSHDELVLGGQAILEGEGDLGEILFAAGAGVSQLKDVQTKLDESMAQLFVAGGRNGSINVLTRDIADKKRELEEAKIPPSDWGSLQKEFQDEQTRVADLEAKLRDAAVQLSRFRSFQNALPLVPQWNVLCQSFVDLADAPQLDEAFSERRRELDTNREIAVRQTRTLSSRIAELRQEMESLGDDSAIMIHEAEIESLYKRLGAREEARTQRVNLQRTRRSLDRRMTEALEELSIEINSTDEDAITAEIDSSLKRLRVVDAVRTRVNELAQQYAMLVRQRDDADENLRTLQRNLLDAEQKRETTIVPDDPFTISQVIESVGSPESVLSNLAQQRADAAQAWTRCQQLARKLDNDCQLASGSFADAILSTVKLRLPNETAIATAARNLERREQALTTVTDLWKQLDASERDERQRLDAAVSMTELPTLDQLSEARDLRDAAFFEIIAEHQSSLIPTPRLTQLQTLIRKADELVDMLRLHHEQLHLQTSIQAEIDKLQQQKTVCRTNGEAAKASFREAEEQWQALWQPLGITAAQPERMVPWISTHGQLVDAVTQWREDTERTEQIEQRIAASCKRLRGAIATTIVDKQSAKRVTTSVAVGAGDGIDAEPTLFDQVEAVDDFSSLYDQAINLRTTLHHARKRFEERSKQYDSMRAELPQAESRLESRQKELDRWDTDWTTATSALAATVDRTPAVILEKIAQIDSLNAQKRERDIVLHRIRAMFDDDKTYRADVARLSAVLPSDATDKNQPSKSTDDISDSFAVVKWLFQRLQTERSAAKQRAALSTQLESARNQHAAAEQQIAEADVALSRLCEEAACDSPADLIEAEQRSKQRHATTQSKQNIEQQLLLLAGNTPLEKFAEEVSQQQPELVNIEIEQAESKLTETRESLSEAQQRVGELRLRLKQIDGSGRAAELSQEIQFLTGKLQNEIEEYARVKVAAMILKQAIEHYRQENQGPVLQRASETFRQLTRGEYESLKVDFDSRGKLMLFGVRAADKELDVPVSAMSTGTADALYLSLRLASIDHQLTRSTPLPLVVDDCLVQLDDDRTIEALRALSQLSLRTQVILFTHHEHLVDLATQNLKPDEYHVHRLASASK
jgi:uncharacterized protein YhaN